MTQIATASTALTNREAGEALASQLMAELGDESPDAVIVFASSQNDYRSLLGALSAGTRSRAIVGCSSAGEFTTDAAGTGMSSAIALRSANMRFTPSVARGLSNGRGDAARSLVGQFRGLTTSEFRYRTAIVFVDALAGHAEDLVDELTTATGGMYQFVGGGAGDDGNFRKTHVFIGDEAFSDAVVALEVLSRKPIGIGARHGWTPASGAMRVTETSPSCVVSFNIAPAVEAFEEHAEVTQQSFNRADPLPFFLHNVVGVATENGHKLRVPLGVDDGGGILTAAEVPIGSTAHIMSTGAASAADAATNATRDAVAQVENAGHKVKAALFFDCVATRLRLGKAFGHELEAVDAALGGAPFVGFNSYGQIVRAAGQFSGFHNCTAVVCAFPD